MRTTLIPAFVVSLVLPAAAFAGADVPAPAPSAVVSGSTAEQAPPAAPASPAAPAAPAAPQAAAPSASATIGGPTTAKATADDPMICRTESTLGSRIRQNRECRTRSEWQRRAREVEEAMNAWSRKSSTQPGGESLGNTSSITPAGQRPGS